MKTQISLVVNILISTLRSVFRNENVVAAIKAAAAEAMGHGEWSDGEKTAFIISAATAIAAATPTPFDDFVVQALAFLYMQKHKAKAAEPATDGVATEGTPAPANGAPV